MVAKAVLHEPTGDDSVIVQSVAVGVVKVTTPPAGVPGPETDTVAEITVAT